MEEILQKVVAANNRFSFSLFNAISQQEPSENVFFSPFSIAMCLSMVSNGASGETRRAILKTLGLQQWDLNEINQAVRRLIAGFPKVQKKSNSILDEMNRASRILKMRDADWTKLDEDYWNEIREVIGIGHTIKKHFYLTVANSLWVNKDVKFEKQFLAFSRDNYEAEISALDFANSASLGVINNWIRKATSGTIREVITQLPPATMIMVVNAIYFKAFWKEQFLKSRTKSSLFTLLDGELVDCQMMSCTSTYHYWEDNDLQIIRLPYDSQEINIDIGMYVLLPKRKEEFVSLLQKLALRKWETLINQVNNQRLYGEISLPRFRVEYSRDITPDLKVLSMECAFDPDCADFSHMSTTLPQLWLSKVQHKAFIKVDEEGTEAGAVTASIMVGAMPRSPAFHMVVDHPFVYMISDKRTDSILFMGITTDPR